MTFKAEKQFDMTVRDLFKLLVNRFNALHLEGFTGETAIRVHWSQGGIGKVGEERKEVLK